MELVIRINLDNAAFHENMESELKRIGENMASDVADGETGGNIRDSNGNRVGHFEVLE